MLCYHTQLKVNDEFNQNILYDIFFDWLQTTKNRMEGLEFKYDLPFMYKIENKELNIKKFEHENILAIHYVTSNNDKKNRFTVEILYSIINHTLDLNFYITLTDDSKYFRSISIPMIFRMLIRSPYILDDHSLPINDQPIYRSTNAYSYLIKTKYDLPLIVLRLNDKRKGVIHPFKLAKELTGIAHVICITNAKEDMHSIITIRYPNKQEFHQKVNPSDHETFIIHNISNKIRNLYILESKNIYSYQKLTELELKHQHLSSVDATNQYQELFKQEIQDKYDELNFLKEQYQELLLKQQQLKVKNTQLESEIEKLNETPILVCEKEQVKEFQDFLLPFIEKHVKNFDPTRRYRKRDVLESILLKNKHGGQL